MSANSVRDQEVKLMSRISTLAFKSIFSVTMVAALVFPTQGYSQKQNFQPPVDQAVYIIKPSDTDSRIRNFDAPNYVILNKGISDRAQLVIFMPGTSGKPRNTPFFTVISDLGYRIINLEYNDAPAVNVVCPKDPDPDCSANFRQDRIYGGKVSSHTGTPPPETIMNRITKLLKYLVQHNPQEHWAGYLVNGKPDWSRIVVCGLSQGAGMAAYIAKHQAVARVVLFSSPADFVLERAMPDGDSPAAWLKMSSATPMDRWYAEYHARERATTRLQRAYHALGIPEDHIFVFDLDLQVGSAHKGDNPFHGSTITNTGYSQKWRSMFGFSLK